MSLKPTDAELIIGIVARIGVDTAAVVKAVKDELHEYGYSSHEIHVTDLLKRLNKSLNIVEEPADKRYESLISACNDFRTETGMADIMAQLAMLEITSIRGETGPGTVTERRSAYIINQIKRPEEFEILRSVYGEHYVQISCHATLKAREARLAKKIANSHPESPRIASWEATAASLIQDDEAQEDKPFGQRVRDVFPLSDVVVNAHDRSHIKANIERFLRALFGDNTVTPTAQEYGMELANTASQRSSDLSRQVGAAILNPHNEVQALGCNEVPKAKGGTYWEGDEPDGREFNLGSDANDARKREVLLDLVIRLGQAGGLKEGLDTPEAIQSFIFDRADKTISDAQVMDSLEYGRSVHAEMNAITDAARGGHAIRGCTLYCNTFPCHNCAKHIVASGIDRVVYLRPYPKSYAGELFEDSICIDPDIQSERLVNFNQFIGISGPMYARVFTKSRWKKDGGKVPDFLKPGGSFVRRTPIPAYPGVEALLLDDLSKVLFEKGFIEAPEGSQEESTETLTDNG
jgi:deoxycytidylate deaminase